VKHYAAAIIAGLISTTACALEGPDTFLQRVTDDLINTIRQDAEIHNGDVAKAVSVVEHKVLPYFNFQHMTALAVGRDWKTATAAQKERLAGEFETLLVRTYANALAGYKDQKIIYRPSTHSESDTDVTVHSEIRQAGANSIQLDYSLEKIDGNWKVYDVSVAGISLVTNYRSQFAKEVRSSGIDSLIASIAAKNKSLISPPQKQK
jgi:phospholipid transport system substrate-binding protein